MNQQEEMIRATALHHVACAQDAIDGLYDEVCQLARAVYGTRLDHVETKRRSFLVQTSDAEPGTRMVQRRNDSTYSVLVVLRSESVDDVTLGWGRDEVSALRNTATQLREHSERCVERALAARAAIGRIDRRLP